MTRVVEKILTLFVGISAVAGAVMMWIDPMGTRWGMAPLLEGLRAKMPWPEVFFNDFVPSSIVLLVLNGVTQFVAAWLLFRRHRYQSWAVMACGVVLMLWIVLEWWLWGFNTMSNIYFAIAVAEIAVSVLDIKLKNIK